MKRTKLIVSILFLALVAAACMRESAQESTQSQPASPPAAQPQAQSVPVAAPGSSVDARKIYDTNSAKCHLAGGQGSHHHKEIPDFRNAAWQQKHPDQEFIAAITNGRGKEMPAWKGKLTPEQINAVLHDVLRKFPASAK